MKNRCSFHSLCAKVIDFDFSSILLGFKKCYWNSQVPLDTLVNKHKSFFESILMMLAHQMLGQTTNTPNNTFLNHENMCLKIGLFDCPLQQ